MSEGLNEPTELEIWAENEVWEAVLSFVMFDGVLGHSERRLMQARERRGYERGWRDRGQVVAAREELARIEEKRERREVAEKEAKAKSKKAKAKKSKVKGRNR